MTGRDIRSDERPEPHFTGLLDILGDDLEPLHLRRRAGQDRPAQLPVPCLRVNSGATTVSPRRGS